MIPAFTLFPQTKPPKVKDAPTGPPVWLDVSLEAGTVLTHVSQTTIHTIALSALAWGQTGLCEAERVIFNHHIICNDTHEALRLGQVRLGSSGLLFLDRSSQGHLYTVKIFTLSCETLHNYYFGSLV